MKHALGTKTSINQMKSHTVHHTSIIIHPIDWAQNFQMPVVFLLVIQKKNSD